MKTKKVYEIILKQLGGVGKLKAMIGINKIRYGDNTLCFNFKGSRKANMCQIKLNGNDLYDIKFYYYDKKNIKLYTKEDFKDIYASQLKELFKNYTGLNLCL